MTVRNLWILTPKLLLNIDQLDVSNGQLVQNDKKAFCSVNSKTRNQIYNKDCPK